MREILKALEEFHTAFGHPVADKPSIPALQTCNLRFRFFIYRDCFYSEINLRS